LRRAEAVKPDTTVFPTFGRRAWRSLRTESEKFVAELFQKARPISELLTGTFTYVTRAGEALWVAVPAALTSTRVDLTG